MSVICRKVGNGLTATIPNNIVKTVGIRPGDEVEISIDKNRIVLTPKKKRLRGEFILENFYNKPLDQIGKIDTEIVDWGEPVGEEVW